MGAITIVNQHHGARTGVYVGRPSVLGNPYRVEELGREQAVARYRVWLRQQWKLGGAPRAALLALARQYKAEGKLVLSCWCAPRRCHAEIIREAVLGIVQHGLVERQPGHQEAARWAGFGKEATMKLIIAGSRTFTDYQRLCQTLAPERPRITQVITGGARGADQLGYRWAWKHAVTHQLFRADWERFGRSAGIRRNLQMAQAGDVLIAFWDGQSPGTAHMVQCMRQLGKPVVVIQVEATSH